MDDEQLIIPELKDGDQLIAPRLKGGLGNQMFQIAAAYGAARTHGAGLAIDLSITHTSGQGHPHKKYDRNLYIKVPRFSFNGTEFDMYNEPKFSHTDIPKPTDGKHMIIDGYFQSELYFNHISTDVKRLFKIPEDIQQGVKEKIDKIKNHFNKELAVCVHVRRGEYLMLPNIHPVQTVDFYRKAMSLFDESKTVFIVISDDMKWCVNNLNIHTMAFCNSGYDYDTKPVTDELPELFDMYLASQCDGNIISNSSFGWWGAWLNVVQRVVAPARWFGPDGPPDYQDIYCESWKIV